MDNRFRLAATAFLMALGAQAMADPLVIPRPVPYADDAVIAGKIKKECQIQEQLADYIEEYAREDHRLEVRFADSVQAQAAGLVLDVHIKDAVSEGNPFIGHRKSTTVIGKLYRDGELIGSFTGRRNSMGGMFAGYKGSCSVLGRTVRALGEDIAKWLAAPSMDALLGDLS
ncbi:hypothetical protein SAMN05216289_13010 [Dokdonella immobilis]|uniref:DUF4410 domain-containing protein n=2 Tax=Dokdonella immobilis TaxID=578942 RepID=A0A1I4ZXZ4_9GAMM|nr:hypothetical protein SAMN05216289_13010 [Dokdonella immobilis]